MDSYVALVDRFVAVADAGSVQRAATRLHISQPALTQSIKKIEEVFDCQLFERSKRGMVLTLAGEHLYARSRRMLDQSSLARHEIADILQGRSGTLRIAAGTAWGYCFLPPVIRDLQSAFSELQVELDIAITPSAIPRLKSGDVDVVLGASEAMTDDDPTFLKKPLMTLSFAAACGQSSPLRKRGPLGFADFADVPIVVYEDDKQLMEQVIGKIERELGFDLNIAVRTKSLMAAMELVSTGPYVIFLARPFLQKFSNAGVHLLPLRPALHSFETAAYFRRSLLRTRPFQQFIAAIEKLDANWRG